MRSVAQHFSQLFSKNALRDLRDSQWQHLLFVLSLNSVKENKITYYKIKSVISLFIPIDIFPTRENAQTKQHHYRSGPSCHLVLSLDSLLLSNQWRMLLSRQRVSIPRAGICYWYGKSGLTKLYSVMMFAFLRFPWRWGATLQPDNCHKLSFSF